MEPSARYHYMDNLRALAMLAGVAFHAALAHSVLLHPFWPAADADPSPVVDVVAWFLHLFRMPLFFVIAGFFAALLVRRGGMAGLFRNRLRRVLVPLVVFLPVLLASMHWLTAGAVANVRNPSPALTWLRAYAAEHGAIPPPLGLAHLWFLMYLLLFAVLAWVVSTLEPRRAIAWLAGMRPITLAIAMPLLLAPFLALTTVPWPAPESFVPSLWALASFGIHFALGYLLFHRAELLDGLRPLAPALLVGALCAYAVLFHAVMPWSTGVPAGTPASPLQHAVHAALEACAGAWMTLWCLAMGRAWLDRQNGFMRWLADASYWVYLVHLPLLFAIQYPLLDVDAHWTVKLAIATVATYALALASYHWLVRPTIIGRLLAPRLRVSRPATRLR